MASRNKRMKRELEKRARQNHTSGAWGRGITMKDASVDEASEPPPGYLPDASVIAEGSFTRRILEHLEQVEQVIRAPSQEVFFHWLLLVNNALIAMPDHLQEMVTQGFRPDQPTNMVQVLYHQVDSAVPRAGYASKTAEVWNHYIEAAKILFESLQLNMWDFQDANGRGLGPDIVGGTYLAYALRDPDWETYPLLSWEVLVKEAHQKFPAGEKEILSRLKNACECTRAGRSILEEYPKLKNSPQLYNWLINKVIPAAIAGGFEPLAYIDAWSGTGARLLAMAVQYPEWAIRLRLIQWASKEPDPMCKLMTEINKLMWGFNGYYFVLLKAIAPSTVPIPVDFRMYEVFRLAWQNFQPDKQGGTALTATPPATQPLMLADLFPTRADEEYLEFPLGEKPYWAKGVF